MVPEPGDQSSDWPADAVWGLILGAGVGFELWAMRRRLDHTFTRRTRRHFRTHHPVGKAAFIVGWTGLWAWYLKHIVKGS